MGKIWVPVAYKEEQIKIRQFNYSESLKFAVLKKMLNNPIEKEDVTFKHLVDTYRKLIKSKKDIETFDLYAFKELAIMITTFSSDNSLLEYEFPCANHKYLNPDKKYLSDRLSILDSKLLDTPEDKEILSDKKAILEELKTLENYITCPEVIKGSITYNQMGYTFENLYQREVVGKSSTVYSLTIKHMLLFENLVKALKGTIITAENLKIDDMIEVDITTFDNLKGKIIYDVLKTALFLLKIEDLSLENLAKAYNKIQKLSNTEIIALSQLIQKNLEIEKQNIEIACKRCSKKYKLKVSLEDFKYYPV